MTAGTAWLSKDVRASPSLVVECLGVLACESGYLTGTQAICSVSTWPLEAPWKRVRLVRDQPPGVAEWKGPCSGDEAKRN